ncbi:hypothetical protein Tco_0399178, partial [Tanacetum coccineum]
MPPKKTPMCDAAIKELIAQGVADALAKYKSHKNSNPNGDGSHNSGSRNGRPLRAARECTYKEFLNCQPLNFMGTERSRWSDSMVRENRICIPHKQLHRR